MKACITSFDPITQIATVGVGFHEIQSGGSSDGFCYKHQTFCELEPEEDLDICKAVCSAVWEEE